jgi:hypothetical protein
MVDKVEVHLERILPCIGLGKSSHTNLFSTKPQIVHFFTYKHPIKVRRIQLQNLNTPPNNNNHTQTLHQQLSHPHPPTNIIASSKKEDIGSPITKLSNFSNFDLQQLNN